MTTASWQDSYILIFYFIFSKTWKNTWQQVHTGFPVVIRASGLDCWQKSQACQWKNKWGVDSSWLSCQENKNARYKCYLTVNKAFCTRRHHSHYQGSSCYYLNYTTSRHIAIKHYTNDAVVCVSLLNKGTVRFFFFQCCGNKITAAYVFFGIKLNPSVVLL